jgi:hypothetical protein
VVRGRTHGFRRCTSGDDNGLSLPSPTLRIARRAPVSGRDAGEGRTSGRHSSGANLKLRRAAAVARSSRRVRNSTQPSTILKSSRWMGPQSSHCSRRLRMHGRVHSPDNVYRYGECAKDIIIMKFRNVDLVHVRDPSACTQSGWRGPREPLFPREASAQERVPLPTPFLAEGWSLNDRSQIDIPAAATR